MQDVDSSQWKTDEKLFAGLAGGDAIIGWFGYVPAFHDASLTELVLGDRTAAVTIRSSRTTDEVGSDGFCVQDKHASVTIRFDDVTGVSLAGDATSIIFELGIRRVGAELARFSNCPGPGLGDLEVSIESSYGLEGSIYARNVRLALLPESANVRHGSFADCPLFMSLRPGAGSR